MHPLTHEDPCWSFHTQHFVEKPTYLLFQQAKPQQDVILIDVKQPFAPTFNKTMSPKTATLAHRAYFEYLSVMGQPQSLKQKFIDWLSKMLTFASVSCGIKLYRRARADWNVRLYRVLYTVISELFKAASFGHNFI